MSKSIIKYCIAGLLIAVLFITYQSNEWEQWEFVPADLQGTFISTTTPEDTRGPYKIVVGRSSVRYVNPRHEGETPYAENILICDGTNSRSRQRYNIWVPECGSGSHYEISMKNDGIVAISMTLDPDFGILWSGAYNKVAD